ncbi:DUF2723 domain-containing protein [Candidatus Desantisbacteria bacterium]|nr:DUF2723 domain-containing protein [Candidatus Desantisbacteria bacterium]
MIKDFFNGEKFSYQEKKYMIAILIFLIAMAGYLKTLSPTISFEDSGEFVTISYVLGDAHPPGYPLYTLIGKIASLFPISSIAFRVILLSAFCGAGVVVFVYFIILLLLENSNARTSVFAAACAALFFAFSNVLWDLSIVDEVYSMGTFFTVFQIFMLLKWEKSLREPYSDIYEKYSLKRMGYLYAFSMLYGLCIGVHHTAVLFVVAYFYFILINDHKLLLDPTSGENAAVTIKNSAILLFMWCLGFMVYFYLPVRSLRNPLVDWGDPETWQGFKDVFLRKQYGGVPGLISNLPQFLKKIAFFDIVDQFTMINPSSGDMKRQFMSFAFLIIFPITPVLLGIWRQFKLNIKHFVFLSCTFVSYALGFLFITDPPVPYELPLLLQTFYIPVHMIIIIWMGIGFTYIADMVKNILKEMTTAKRITAFMLITSILLLPIVPYNFGLATHNQAKHYFAYDYGSNMLRSVERNGVIFTFLAQDTFPLWYLTKVEGRRKDAVVVHQRLLSLPWHSKQERINNPGFNAEYPRLAGYDAYNLYLIADLATQSIILKNPNRPMYFSNFRTREETQKYPQKETGIIAKISSEPNPPRIVGRDVFNYYVYRQQFREGEVSKDNRVREISSVYVYGHEFEASTYNVYRNLAQAYEFLGLRDVAVGLLEKSMLYDNRSKDAQITKGIIERLKNKK